MNTREGPRPQLSETPLPNGTPLTGLTDRELRVTEWLICGSEEKPVERVDLVPYAYGHVLREDQPWGRQALLDRLSRDLTSLRKKMEPLGWKIVNSAPKGREPAYFLQQIPAEVKQPEEPLAQQFLIAVNEPEVRSVISNDAIRAANRVHQLVPHANLANWGRTGEITQAQYSDQVFSLVKHALSVQNGTTPPVLPIDILKTPDVGNRRVLVAQDKIRELLAPMVLNTDDKSASKRKWALQMRELEDWLGKNAKQHLRGAIENLPEVERALVLSNSSVNLLSDLEFIDLEDCDELRIATYMRNTLYGPREFRDDDFQTLLDAAIDRSEAGEIRLQNIVEVLIQPPYNPNMFERMMECAQFGRYTDELVLLFSEHPETYPLVRKLDEFEFAKAEEGDDEKLDEDVKEPELPQHRIAH